EPSDVEKRKLLYELEDELWKLIKNRAWIVGVFGLTGIVGLVTLTVKQLADSPLQEIQKKLVEANLLAERAKASATDANGASEQVRTQFGSLTASLQGLKDQAKGVEDQFRLVLERINAEAKTAAARREKDSSAIQQRISALEDLVKKIGEENEATRKATADYAKKVGSVEAQIEQEQKRFAENSQYTVRIQFAPAQKGLAQQLQARLSGAGFKVPIIDMPVSKLPSIKLPSDPSIKSENVLLYTPQSENKAQEVLALLKPFITGIQARKAPELEVGDKFDFFSTHFF